jgi:hypothetical protein
MPDPKYHSGRARTNERSVFREISRLADDGGGSACQHAPCGIRGRRRNLMDQGQSISSASMG